MLPHGGNSALAMCSSSSLIRCSSIEQLLCAQHKREDDTKDLVLKKLVS